MSREMIMHHQFIRLLLTSQLGIVTLKLSIVIWDTNLHASCPHFSTTKGRQQRKYSSIIWHSFLKYRSISFLFDCTASSIAWPAAFRHRVYSCCDSISAKQAACFSNSLCPDPHIYPYDASTASNEIEWQVIPRVHFLNPAYKVHSFLKISPPCKENGDPFADVCCIELA